MPAFLCVGNNLCVVWSGGRRGPRQPGCSPEGKRGACEPAGVRVDGVGGVDGWTARLPGNCLPVAPDGEGTPGQAWEILRVPPPTTLCVPTPGVSQSEWIWEAWASAASLTASRRSRASRDPQEGSRWTWGQGRENAALKTPMLPTSCGCLTFFFGFGVTWGCSTSLSQDSLGNLYTSSQVSPAPALGNQGAVEQRPAGRQAPSGLWGPAWPLRTPDTETRRHLGASHSPRAAPPPKLPRRGLDLGGMPPGNSPDRRLKR